MKYLYFFYMRYIIQHEYIDCIEINTKTDIQEEDKCHM